MGHTLKKTGSGWGGEERRGRRGEICAASPVPSVRCKLND